MKVYRFWKDGEPLDEGFSEIFLGGCLTGHLAELQPNEKLTLERLE